MSIFSYRLFLATTKIDPQLRIINPLPTTRDANCFSMRCRRHGLPLRLPPRRCFRSTVAGRLSWANCCTNTITNVSNVTAPPPLRPIRPKTRLRIGRASSLLLLLDLLCDFVVASVASHHYNLRPLTPHKHLCHGFV